MTFTPVANANQIPPGSAILIEINNLEIALFRLGDEFYATSNLCLHQAGPLSEGKIEGEQVVCPWHYWRFNIKDGTSPLSPKLKLKTYPVQREGDQIFIGLP
ncbi:MAG: non-heme iron oxygenase ferredoxin subunit [Nitrospirae bacterium]|nr:non-heme iron oxygenase ferredoxin subunit [Candidatus Manganitrophaceae bacterium]